MEQSALFIDNSNFYHSLKDERRLPFPPADYDKLFAELKDLGFMLNKIFLYDAVKDISKEPHQYASQQKFHEGIRNLASKWPVEIKTRKLKYRKAGKKFSKEEKGVDVLLVIDAIRVAMTKKIKSIIILSGDADFVPAVKFIEDELKVKVVNLHLYAGSSTELRTSCKRHILIDFERNNILLKTNGN